ncbi:MAG: DUF4988 domain-containing protein [Tannerella sp.]|jgi:hypothetical protein|nr:DUF4988 domain-containing protein [Tannerella sp.]
MIKTKFILERSIIGCVILFFFALIVFAGCGKDYDADIDRLTRKTNSHDTVLNTLQAQITAIENRIANAQWITGVSTSSTGYTIQFNNGSVITINHGSPGTAAVIWQIGSGAITGTRTDSLWHRILPDGTIEATDAVAIPPRGRDGVDGTPGNPVPVRAPDIVDGYWVTYEWNPSANDFTETSHREYPIVSDLVAYVTDDPSNPNQWLLRVKRGATGDAYESIFLPKNAAALPGGGTVTLLGHISPPYNASTLSLSAIDTSVLVVKYWYLDSVYNVNQSTKLTEWQGRKRVRPTQLLSTLPKELSLVLTSDIILSNACKLKNSKGEAQRLAISAPVEYTGLLTKAESVSGGAVYLANLSVVDSTYATIADVTANFANKFVPNAVYYLENEAGIKSNYAPFSIRPENHSADVVATVANVTRLVAPDGGSFSVNAGAVTVTINTGYTVGFEVANDLYLYDYNIADGNSTGDIDVYPAEGSFVARQPGIYSLIIRKLLVDGKIHEETISVIAN